VKRPQLEIAFQIVLLVSRARRLTQSYHAQSVSDCVLHFAFTYNIETSVMLLIGNETDNTQCHYTHCVMPGGLMQYQPTKLGNSRGSVVKALDFHSTSPASAICGGRNCSRAPENSHLTRDCMEFKELILSIH